ncbi:MAG: hypothetical protein COA79_08540 [Planctomycetota bacterium]|nr:MAG: hypothetical protein COA79_08540 [Planctomycetota bacterium]
MKIYWLFLTILFFTNVVHADFSGSVTIEGKIFFDKGDNKKSKQLYGAIIFEPEYYKSFSEEKYSFTFRPYAILDAYDNERSHFDIREFNGIVVGSWWELKLGISREYWSVTEFSHLVNIVNQIDFSANIDEDQKLGQPMSHFSLISPVGTFDLFVLFGFRERTYPGDKGRFLFQKAVDTDSSIYESSQEDRHIDFAMRYSHSISIFDFALSAFHGTNREPSFSLSDDGNFMVPYYSQMSQAGLETQASSGDTLYKLEAIYRDSDSDEYFSFNIGIEHTFGSLWSSTFDLGLLLEYLYDEREDEATTPFANDLFFGMRLTANDTNDTQLLAGLGQDLDHQSQVISVEVSRRLTNNLKISIDARWFISHKQDFLSVWESEDFIKINLSYYF